MSRSGVVMAVALVWLQASAVSAERLPIKAYTTADGLAHNGVNRIIRDSRGLLWFATNDGVSRFDGYAFSNYGVDHGLPHGKVTDLLETKTGEFWLATFGGLVRFRPDGVAARRASHADAADRPPMFTVVVPADADPRAHAVNVLLESSDGTIWCGTRKGLFRLERAGGRLDLRYVDLGLLKRFPMQEHVNDLVEDQHGSLWVATPSGLYRHWRDGTAARYGSPHFMGGYDHLHDLMKDHLGRIWVGSRYDGFFRIDADASRRMPVIVEHYGYPRRPGPWVYQLMQTSDRRFWVASNLGLLEFLPAARGDASRFRAYDRSHGLSHQEVTSVAEDAGGNLWIGTWTGAMRIARDGFVTFARDDQLAGANAMFEDSTGELYVQAATFLNDSSTPEPARRTAAGDGPLRHRFGRFDGRQFDWFEPGPPFAWGSVPEASVLRTRGGEWWLAGSAGLLRYGALSDFSKIKTATPVRTFTTRNGLPDHQIYRLFEDSRGDVWVSILGGTNGLLLWNRTTDSLRNMAGVDGCPQLREDLPRAFAEDRAGNVWIGLNTGVARYRDARFTTFTAASGLAAGSIVAIHPDAAGRLWLASSRAGLIRVDDPTAKEPVFKAYTTADGLSGNSIEVITEDVYGRIYASTGRGIDQFDPRTGSVKHFTIEDGLAPGWMLAAFRDRSGALWFGTHTGLSRFLPPPPEPSAPPPILITGLSVAGTTRAVSAIGETALTLSDLRPGANQLQIDFASVRFASGERLRYQYRLEGADREWGSPSSRRSVTYANLSPGRYRFLVRAVNADGLSTSMPAVVTFRVLPPVWLQWWFLSIMILATGAAALAMHRYRVARVLEIERVRTRIATDLHDDIGANLTRIAILSEVARQQSSRGEQHMDVPLSSIATIARESATSMSDIVWAISPERDTLQDVVRKMRDHAEEVFEARDISLMLDLPDPAQPIKVGVDVRRDLYLIFKEAVNNAARHSGCTRVSIALRIVGSRLALEVADNGIGFDPSSEGDGHGLASIRRRADRLGATVEFETAPGAGTTIRLTMPLGAAVPAI